jgi:hypothetical protein
MGGAVGALGACRDTTPPTGSTTATTPSSITDDSESPSSKGSGTSNGGGVAPDADGGRNMVMSAPRPVYGPPAGFPGDRIPGLKGSIVIAPVTATVQVPNADHAIAIAQPALRTCYQTGLRREPAMAGTLKITISIDATGAVSSVTTDGPLSAPVQACMKDRIKLIKFDAPGSASSVTTEIACTSTHD